MNYSKFRITLDIHKHQSQVSIPVMYGDTAVQLLVTLSDGGTPYVIGKSCWAQFVANKPYLSEPLLRKCIIENGTTIRLDFDNGIADVAGVYDCEIRLYGAEGILTSPCFTMVVDPRVVADNVGDDMAANGFIDQIGTSMAEFQRAEVAREEAEEERKANEDARKTAEALRESAEAERGKLLNEINKRLPTPTSNDEGRFLKASGGKIVFSDIGDYQFPKLRAPLSVTVDSRGMTVKTENHNSPFILKNYVYIDGERVGTMAEGEVFNFSGFIGDKALVEVGVTAAGENFKESNKIFAKWGLTNGTEGLAYSFGFCTGIGTATGSSIEIASHVDGKPVLYIGSGAFKGNTEIKSVKMLGSVTTISNDAFYGCISLTSVKLSDDLKEIHSCAFQNCKSLTDVAIPDGVELFKGSAFRNTGIKALILPASVKDLKGNSFAECGSLKAALFKGDTTINSSAFGNCPNLTDIYVPWVEPDENTTTWGAPNAAVHYGSCLFYILFVDDDNDDKYYHCHGIGNATDTDIVILSEFNGLQVKGIADGAFKGSNITSVTFPEGMLYFGSSAFQDCTNITSVTIPKGAEYIANSTFRGCTSLTSVTIEGVNIIFGSAFRDCTSLSRVIFNGTPSSITSNTFLNCGKLTDIYVPWAKDEVGGAPWGATNATIHYNSEA